MLVTFWLVCSLIHTSFMISVFGNRPPRFTHSILVVQTEEEKPNGTLVAIVSASDPDGDRVLYQLGTDANRKFRINKNTGEIFLNQKLDREKLGNENSLRFTVYAADVRAPLKRSSLRVVVHVGDINDCSPVFVGLPYTANITEDADIDSFVFRVSAIDADQNNEILYYITDGDEDDTFKIDPYRGVIRTRKSLDYEKKPFYYLNISVEDARPKDPIKHRSYTIMTIGVQDVDDNGAAFDSTNYSAHVREGQLEGTYITRVHAMDLDLGLNAPVQYSLNEDTDPERIFTVDNKTGVVTATGTLDRETKARYSLEIFATSTDHPPAKTLLVVYVDDINDNGPTFDKNTYFTEIMENSRVGSTVLQVKATDPDVLDHDKPTQLHYDIWAEDGTFGITSDGNIFINETVDRERKALFKFKVIAREEGKPPSSAQVTIRILDDNDNSPMFTERSYSAEVRENNSPRTVLKKVSARDKDIGVNGLVTYSIFPDAEGHSNQFDIDSSTGWILANSRLDREKVAAYSLLVKASDNAKDLEKRRFSTARVTIKVLDENDNAPVMTNLKEEANIFQDAWMNSEVATVEATDADTGDFGTVTYSIAKRNDENLFKVDPRSGHIKIAASLMPYAGRTFILTVGAKDNHGRNPYHVTEKNATVLIKIYQSDNAILFVSGRSKQDMTKHAEGFRRDLQKLTGLGISIHQISKSDVGGGSHIILHSFNESTEDVVERPLVLRILSQINEQHIDAFLSKWNITEWKVPLPSTSLSTGQRKQEDAKQRMNIIIYTIIAVCAVIAIGGAAGIYYALKVKRRFYGERSSVAAESILTYRCDNNSYWCSSEEEFENLSNTRRTLTSELPDLIEMYGAENIDNNNEEEENFIFGLKRPSRTDSRGSSMPFANSSCGTIYRAPSLCSTSSQLQLQLGRRSSRASRKHRHKTMGGRISKSEPQLMIRRLSIVLDTDDMDYRCYRHPRSRRYRLGMMRQGQQGTC